MLYSNFCNEILDLVSKELGDEYQVSIQKVLKNNNLSLDGLHIIFHEEKIVPSIYLNSYYDKYQDGATLESITDDILQLYRSSCTPPELSIHDFLDFNSIKDIITIELINTQNNQELLKYIPSVPFYDLSIIFRIILDPDKHGSISAVIHNSHMATWNTNIKGIYRLAIDNSIRMFPVNLKTIAPDAPAFWVLSNDSLFHGAAVASYPGVLRDISHDLDSDLILIPSSIHEFLILKLSDYESFDELTQILHDMNTSYLAVDELLSDHLYFYSRSTDSISFSPTDTDGAISDFSQSSYSI